MSVDPAKADSLLELKNGDVVVVIGTLGAPKAKTGFPVLDFARVHLRVSEIWAAK